MELPGRRELREQILHQMDGRTSYVSDADVYREIDKAILRSGHSGYGTLSEKEELRRQMFSSIRGFDVLEKYLEDNSISEIMVIGASHIFVEQNGRVRRTRDHFFEEADVYRLIEQIVAPTNRMVNEASPIVDSRLPDGSRVHIVLPPVSLEGPVITIRKFLKGGMTIARLLAFGEFPEALTGILSALVKGKYNILISGATNSGKSSLLNALAEYIGQEERVITIEDSAELQLFHVDNLVRLETRNANVEGANEITMQDLIKASLRMRPDRIIVGEVRGAEAMSMLQALSTGHSGSFSSIHANSCRDALRRLETMVLMGMDMPLGAIQGLIASSVDILIHLGRCLNGERKILEISEIKDYSWTEYETHTLFQYGEAKIRAGQQEAGGRGAAVLFLVTCLCIPVHNYLKLKEEGERHRKEAEKDFPVIVHLLTLYMGAGLSFLSAVRRIGFHYQEQKEADAKQKKYAFERVLLMEQQMNNGMSQKEACQNWGMQFHSEAYQKLALILVQSFTKGSKEASTMMEAEEREAFQRRVERAKQEGEEAATRLLFPMIVLLCQVMLLVMYPALIRFQGF